LIWLASDPSKLSKKSADAIRSSIKQTGRGCHLGDHFVGAGVAGDSRPPELWGNRGGLRREDLVPAGHPAHRRPPRVLRKEYGIA